VSSTSHLIVPTGHTGQRVALAPDSFINNLVLALPFNSESVFDDVSPISKATPAIVGLGTTTFSLPFGRAVGLGTTGTVGGIVTFSQYYGTSCYFAGNSAHFEFINDSTMQFGLQDFTLETWFYWRGTKSAFQICGAVNNDFNVFISESGVTHYNGTSYTVSTASTTTGVWHHYALTRKYEVGINSDYKYRVYIDGSEIGSFFSTKNYSSGIGLIVGRNSRTGSTLADGYMQDFRLYKGIAKYTSNFTPPNQIAL